MSDPKRHHWWPQLQSGRWCNADGKLYVTDTKGKSFKTSPINIGVEGHLYTSTNFSGEKNQSIEKWFSEQIDGPFHSQFDSIFDFRRVTKTKSIIEPEQKLLQKNMGYVTNCYLEHLKITQEQREILTNYLAALLVRSPVYLEKISNFHKIHVFGINEDQLKTITLKNMQHLFEIYRNKMANSDLYIECRTGDSEFLFGDSSITIREPWSESDLPFDLHIPMTPDFSIEVIPLPTLNFGNNLCVSRLNNRGIARKNRIIVGASKRFIYSRQLPPTNFIKKYLGKPAPSPYGYRFIDGKLETKYDASRDEKR